MIITGLGLDIVEISRLKGASERFGQKLASRLFTEAELRETPGEGPARWSTLAGKWAAKEAVVKALGTGFRGMSWKDVEITRDAWGRPRVTLTGGAADLARQAGVTGIHVSITHEKGLAAANAVAFTDSPVPGGANSIF